MPNDKVKIWIDDDVGGTFPVDVTIRRDGNRIILENKNIRIQIQTDTLLSVLGDEGHG